MKASDVAYKSRTATRLLLIGLVLGGLGPGPRAQSVQKQALTRDELVQRVLSSIVIVTGTDENGKPLPTGIGFVTAPGVIATSNDVVKDAITIHAKLGNREMSADILA